MLNRERRSTDAVSGDDGLQGEEAIGPAEDEGHVWKTALDDWKRRIDRAQAIVLTECTFCVVPVRRRLPGAFPDIPTASLLSSQIALRKKRAVLPHPSHLYECPVPHIPHHHSAAVPHGDSIRFLYWRPRSYYAAGRRHHAASIGAHQAPMRIRPRPRLSCVVSVATCAGASPLRFLIGDTGTAAPSVESCRASFHARMPWRPHTLSTACCSRSAASPPRAENPPPASAAGAGVSPPPPHRGSAAASPSHLRRRAHVIPQREVHALSLQCRDAVLPPPYVALPIIATTGARRFDELPHLDFATPRPSHGAEDLPPLHAPQSRGCRGRGASARGVDGWGGSAVAVVATRRGKMATRGARGAMDEEGGC
ncbi:hypothetical protein C8J57DRAFT_385449 [Mycena rebaudengoi]|nr:hypothetical protein C8J57DRAFT_385449 [Mycena rebaudengoi]